MSQEKKVDYLLILVVVAVSAVTGMGVISALHGRDSADSERAVADEVATTPVSTISPEWCDEREKGDCLPATCQANARTIVVFHADWCSWCRKLKQETLSDPAVVEALKPFGKVSVDTETNGDTSDAYGVDGIPAIVILDKDCKEALRISGFVDAERLLKELDGL